MVFTLSTWSFWASSCQSLPLELAESKIGTDALMDGRGDLESGGPRLGGEGTVGQREERNQPLFTLLGEEEEKEKVGGR